MGVRCAERASNGDVVAVALTLSPRATRALTWIAPLQVEETMKRPVASAGTDFQSANKKDAHNVTKGKSLMSTTQAGKHIAGTRAKDPYALTKVWVYDVGDKLAEVRISYKVCACIDCASACGALRVQSDSPMTLQMDHVLEGMGITLEKAKK